MKNPVTTITGILLALVTIVAAVGIVTQEQAVSLTEVIPPIVTGIASIIAIFKAGDKGGV